MQIAAAFVGLFLILLVLLDSFETIVLPRRVTQRVRLSKLFYRGSWVPWKWIGRRINNNARRENFLSFYGPLSLLLLVALWVASLIIGFALLQWSIGGELQSPDATNDFAVYLYLSGSSFFTLGLGDVAPLNPVGRFLAVVESGTGFAFLALIIGYLPALNTAFSQREVRVSLLDERAGSPPSALELLRRHAEEENITGIEQILYEWERWSAALLESHLSYPVLGYFRSQHDNQSWVSSLTMILDTSALILAGIDKVPTRQAQLTFAMARHAAVDLTQVYRTPPWPPKHDRLPPDQLALMRSTLEAAGLKLREGEEADRQLASLREMYEPFVNALSQHLLMGLSSWIPPAAVPDAWQTTGWEKVQEVDDRR
jgi:hypothetical protein